MRHLAFCSILTRGRVLFLVCPHSRGAVTKAARWSERAAVAFPFRAFPAPAFISFSLAVTIRYHPFPEERWIEFKGYVNEL